jgi:hypothetical protein
MLLSAAISLRMQPKICTTIWRLLKAGWLTESSASARVPTSIAPVTIITLNARFIGIPR